MRIALVLFALICSSVSFGFVKMVPNMIQPNVENQQNKVHKAYVYQSQQMKYVHWMYIGFAPRMQDPKRVRVVFSKTGYTMRVSLQMTKEEVSNYARDLVNKNTEMNKIIAEQNHNVYQWWRMEIFNDEVIRIWQHYDTSSNYSHAKYLQGLELLKEKFPTNIFEMPNSASLGRNDIGLVAHFVYPITIHKLGKNFPNNGVFTIDEIFNYNFDNASDSKQKSILSSRVQDRRTDYGIRVACDKNGDGVIGANERCRKIKNYIFSGFPAFWIYPSPAGVGVHGPIRYSEPFENNKAGETCQNYPKKMKDFWKANEFIAAHQGYEMQNALPSIKYRWDLIRTNDSAGCFRAETMELRHLLPTVKSDIVRELVWTITDKIDTVTLPGSTEPKYVDVDYYITNHYGCPDSRES